jgi:hypothetical protein
MADDMQLKVEGLIAEFLSVTPDLSFREAGNAFIALVVRAVAERRPVEAKESSAQKPRLATKNTHFLCQRHQGKQHENTATPKAP